MITSLFDLPETTKYLNRIGAEPRSLLKAVVKEEIGEYWTDISIIKFDKDGTITVSAFKERYSPSKAEEEAIKLEFSKIDWPSNKPINLFDSNLPSFWTEAEERDRFAFHDVEGKVVMLQVKRVQKGKRSYIPITYWSDGQYRFVEPDGLLPLYGLDKLKGNSVAIIHEGAGAARAGQEIADGKRAEHPWKDELSNAAHVGFVGGALSPGRTDWSVLKKHGITRAYIVADNDEAGRSAVPKIAKELHMPTFLIQFEDQFPSGFDMADNFPDHMFSKIKDKKYYIGPSFRECLHPATYMTNLVEIDVGKKEPKTVAVLRDHAKSQWIFAEEMELFVNADMPDIVRSASVLDQMLMPFSDSRKTSELILQSFTGRTPKLAYNPSSKGRRIISGGTTAINLYIPPSIKPVEGDPKPFIEYLEYLIPNEKERYEVMKWCATLIAKPEVRMHYALLMISEQTGTGKSTLGDILAKLVGMHNVSYPSESEIAEQFNSWLARKRLVVVNEIYQGQSFKTANKLKSYVTDKTVTMRMLFKDGVSIENFAHFYACSNSLEALRIESADRRWYIPTVTESKWPREKWDDFFLWLNSGGYSIIANWAEGFGDYVLTGEASPLTDRKTQMIYESLSQPQREALDLFENVVDVSMEVSFGQIDLWAWVTREVKGTVYDKPLAIQKLARKMGFVIWNQDDRFSIGGRLQPIFISPMLEQRLQSMKDKDRKDYVKSKLKTVGSFLNDGI